MPGTFRPMLHLVVPVLAERLLHMLVMLVDTWLTGHYLPRPEYMAAITLMAYTMWFLTCLFDLVAIGATAMTARFVGAGDLRSARHVTNQAVFVGACLALVVVLAGFPAAPLFVSAMNLTGLAGDLATRYLWIILPFLPAIMIQRVGIACLRGAGDMASSFVAMSIVNIVNAVVSCVLVIGIWPFPRLGWEGLAVGTACGHAVGGLIVLAMLAAGRAGLNLRRRLLLPNAALVRRLFRVGVPGGIDTMLIICCHMWFVSLINSLGNAAAAAHGVGVRLESLSYLPADAFSVAAATLAGQYLGARDYRKAGRSVLMACLMCCALMVAVGVLFFFAGLPLAGAFLHDDQRAIAVQTAVLLRIVAFGLPLMGLTAVFTGALRGAGDTRWPLLFSLVGFLGIRIPGAYLLAHPACLNLGVEGAWYAMLADISVRCLLVSYRFARGRWKETQV